MKLKLKSKDCIHRDSILKRRRISFRFTLLRKYQQKYLQREHMISSICLLMYRQLKIMHNFNPGQTRFELTRFETLTPKV